MELELPLRKKPGKTSFNTSTTTVREWVDELPLINTERTRVLVAGALTQINALAIPTSERYEALELFATPVMCVTDALKKAFIGKPVPLQAGGLVKATQALELCNQMATGYRILADDLDCNDRQKGMLAIAIHRSLRYLSELLLTKHQIYVQYPEGLWKTMHMLYALAEQCELATQPVPDTTLPAPEPSSIATVYKQILLLSLACPYRLRQNEIHYVYNALVTWADSCRLQAIDSHTNGLFSVNLQSDSPPSYRILHSEDTFDSHWRILDTTGMSNQIRAALAEDPATANRQTGIGDTHTLQRLLMAWGVMPQRKFSRRRESATIRLVIGLNAIHQMIAEPPEETVAEDNGIDESFHDHQYLQDPTFENTTRFTTDPLDHDTGRSNVVAAVTTDEPLRGAYSAGTPASARPEAWQVADMSAGGYSLLWDSKGASSARVGELVAILPEAETRSGNWQLGVVRRMMFTNRRGLELGIQMLSPGAQAVWSRVREDEISIGSRMQGILLPEIRAIHQQESLLLPSLPFRSGCITTLEVDGASQSIILVRQLENTGCFAQYHFAPAGQSRRS